jgi:thioredoxin-related protein
MERKIKITFVLVYVIIIAIQGFAQENKINLYNPLRDANKQIDSALAIASKEKKHLLLQVGGNWCSWCVMLHKFYSSDPQIDSALKANYIVEYINYSKENKNPEVLKRLDFPQRFGFPVLVILDGKGKRLHTQNSAYLEEGRGYNKEKVLEFLKQWTPSALNPENYKQ